MKQFFEWFDFVRPPWGKAVAEFISGSVLMVSLVVPVHSERWTGQVSALDGHRLAVIRTGQFTSSRKSPAEVTLLRHRSTVFGSAVSLKDPLQAKVSIRFEGKYELWVRIGRPDKLPHPVTATFGTVGRVLAQARINGLDGGSPMSGHSGYGAYRDAAQKFSRTIDPRKSNDRIGEDLLTELADSRVQALRRWADLNRLDDIDANLPFYWWKLSPVDLKPGEHVLDLAFLPEKKDDKGVPPVVDAAFLTTNLDLPYPYLGEIDATPASYARFSIDSLPPKKKELRVELRAQLHHGPWGAGANLAPNGINHSKPSSHSKTGYTRWYRLQDIENFSRFGGSSLSISLNIDPSAKGSTEFAVFPHEDFILHRFDWNEPDGKRLAMRTDFRTLPWSVRTFRDYAREHYQMALRATGNRLFTLARPPLFFTNGWGNDSGSGNDYMVKTLRLLGFNSCAAPDNEANSRRYGWRRAGGHYWPPVWMPYDESASTKKYREHYAKEFVRRRESWTDIGTFQIADEPQEMKTNELSSPLWIYRAAADGSGRWFDPTNSSELLTRRKDLSDCVLEGVLHCGGIFELRVGRFSGEKPAFGFWSVGQRRNSPVNLVAGVHGGRQGGMKRPGANSNQNGLPFKIVYQAINKRAKDALTAGTAALYCNNQLMSQLNGLPSQGGFAILKGNEKSISKLRLRAISKEERLADSMIDLDREKKAPSDDLLADLEGVASAKPRFVDKDLRRFVEEDWVWGGGLPEAHVGFRKWLRERGVSLREVGADSWDKVRLMTIQSLADTPDRRRQYYWSRRYANYLTPRTFSLAAEGIRSAFPEKDLKGFVALSGHALYLGKTAMPLDMFELAKYPELTPGVSDWMTSGSWRWDSHQAVAYSVAPFNSGARRYGRSPVNFPMMHCVYPSVFRSYTQLANQCKLISYWTFGPSYAATEGFWSDNFWSYHAVHKLNNRAAQLDDVLSEAVMRPSRVAMLYSHSTHLWSSADSYNDKRAAFLGLSHEYFQPELVTEEQVVDDCLRHYDALYVLEPHVSRSAQSKISEWTRGGGLLWTCSNSLLRDEYDESSDWLAKEVGIRRVGDSAGRIATIKPVPGQPSFRPHAVTFGRRFDKVSLEGGLTRAIYDDGSPAWLEKPLGRGRVVYVGHRAGLTYSGQRISIGGRSVVWADAGRDTLTRPLRELGVERDLVLSERTVMAAALTTESDTVIVLYNMRPKSITPLTIKLKEKSHPKAVMAFEGDRLVDLPFDFVEGELTITLPRLNLNEGQMILVRGNPALVDPRPAVMKKRVFKLLSSDDPMDLSAGAWFAGFHSEWNLQDLIVPLVGHVRWEVRRSAVEALGRLRYRPIASRLVDLIEDDSDDHVRADALYALALIDPAVFAPAAKPCALHESPIIRMETMRAVDTLLSGAEGAKVEGSGSSLEDDLSIIVSSCLEDDVSIVRHLAIEQYGRLESKSLLTHVLKVILGSEDLVLWAKAVASNDVAFSQYLARGMPGGDGFFFALARVRQDAALVQELKRRFDSGERSERLINAIEHQRDEGLMRLVLKKSETLGESWRSRLPHQLETAMDMGLGRDLEVWTNELKLSE